MMQSTRETRHGRLGWNREHPDTQPGHYYVSAQRGDRYALALGPFTQERPGPEAHAYALALVSRTRHVAADLEPRTWFDRWGTCRVDLDAEPEPGRLNAHLESEARGYRS